MSAKYFQTAARSRPGVHPRRDKSIYRNRGSFLLCAARHAIDLFVDQAAQSFPEFHTGIVEVIFRRLGPAGPERIRNPRAGAMAEATFTRLLLFTHTISLISTVRIFFSNRAFDGVSEAMLVGSPMCRRRVPISTTSSSPFLNNPTSPFAAKGSR